MASLQLSSGADAISKCSNYAGSTVFGIGLSHTTGRTWTGSVGLVTVAEDGTMALSKCLTRSGIAAVAAVDSVDGAGKAVFQLITGSDEGQIEVWKVESDEDEAAGEDGSFGLSRVSGCQGHGNVVSCIDSMPDGASSSASSAKFASGGWDCSIMTWDSNSMAPTAELKGHTQHVTAVNWSSSNDLFSTAMDGVLRHWDVRTSRSAWGQNLNEPLHCVRNMKHADENIVVVGTETGRLCAVDIRAASSNSQEGCPGLLQELHVHSDRVTALDMDGQGKRIASVGDDGRLAITMVGASGDFMEPVSQLVPHRGAYAKCLAWDLDSTGVFTAGWDKKLTRTAV